MGESASGASGQGWICPSWGGWVGAADAHACRGGPTVPPTAEWWSPPAGVPGNRERMAEALERIATAVERLVEVWSPPRG